MWPIYTNQENCQIAKSSKPMASGKNNQVLWLWTTGQGHKCFFYGSCISFYMGKVDGWLVL